jgi:FAD/FMN-containing dehydrogenase
MTRLYDHNNKLNRIIQEITSSNKKISTKRTKNVSKTLRQQNYKNECFCIDMTDFDGILELTDEYVCLEPNVTMEQIVNFLSPKKLSLNIITEFKTMTIGGAISGLGAESSSFKYGLIHNNVVEYEIINENGIVETVDENHNLFYMIPGSYGSICIITAIKIKVCKIQEYVNVEFIRTNQIQDVDIYDDSYDFIEGIILNKNDYVVIKGYYTRNNPTYNLRNRFSRLFFDFVKDKECGSIVLTYYDYIFRWDRGSFWVAHNKNITYTHRIICSMGLNDLSFDDKLTTENLYKHARTKDDISRESKSMYQDIMIPFDNFIKFKTFIDDSLKIYPIWLLPIESNMKQSQPYGIKNGIKYVNFGIYGGIKHLGFDFIKINQNIERRVIELNGVKTLYNQSYYEKDEFYKLYLDYPTSKFIDLYSKTCELYNNVKDFYALIKILIDEGVIYDSLTYNKWLNHYKNIKELQSQMSLCAGTKSDKQIMIKRRLDSHCTHKLNKDNVVEINTQTLNSVLSHDDEYVYLEPSITMNEVMTYLEKYDKMLYVVPEFKNLTIGGLIQGGGIESSSFKYGQLDDTAVEYEILLSNGTLIKANDKTNSDIFYGMNSSIGTLGILTYIKLKIRPMKKFVNVNIIKFNKLECAMAYINEIYNGKSGDVDFIDGIMFDKTNIKIITGRLTDELNLSKLIKLNSKFGKWYYDICKDSCSEFHEEKFTLHVMDYLFRFDLGCFWMANYARVKKIKISNYPMMKRLLSHYFTTERMYVKYHSKSEEERSKRFIIHDIYIPSDNVESFVDYIIDAYRITPLWLLPIKPVKSDKFLCAHYNKDNKLMYDIGIYGEPAQVTNGGLLDPVKTNIEMENVCNELNAKKMTYASYYSDKSTYLNILSKNTEWSGDEILEKYNRIREKYSSDKLKHIIDKILVQ